MSKISGDDFECTPFEEYDDDEEFKGGSSVENSGQASSTNKTGPTFSGDTSLEMRVKLRLVPAITILSSPSSTKDQTDYAYKMIKEALYPHQCEI